MEKLRDKVYSILENHCRMFYQDRINRFGKLLVRLPALRSIGLKCVEHLFFPLFQQENNNPEQSIGRKIFNFVTKIQILNEIFFSLFRKFYLFKD